MRIYPTTSSIHDPQWTCLLILFVITIVLFTYGTGNFVVTGLQSLSEWCNPSFVVDGDWSRLRRFIVDHDVTVTETRSALSFCRDHGLQNPVSFHLPGYIPILDYDLSHSPKWMSNEDVSSHLSSAWRGLSRVDSRQSLLTILISRQVSKLMKMKPFRSVITIKKV